MSARSLRGARVLVTRSSDQASQLSRALRKLGATVVEAPAIRLAPPRSWTAVDRALRSLDRFEWVVLTSANGVRFLLERMSHLGVGVSALRKVKIAAVGPGTASALRRARIRPALVPDTFTTKAVGKAFPRGSGHVLLARADRTEPGLEETLRKRGWSPHRVVLYRLLRAERADPAVKKMLSDGDIDVATFASGGTVRAFSKLYPKGLPVSVRVACIGPITAGAARDAGYRVDAVASEHTISGLAMAAAEAWAAR